MSERDIKKLLALVEKHLGTSWLDISDWLRSQNSLDAIESRLLAGDYAGLVQEVESAAARFAAETHSQFVRAGQAGSEWLDSQPALADKLIRFDAVNDRAVLAARRNEYELIQGLTAETRQTIRQVVVDGQRAGLNPRTIARDIRDSITLTPNQAQHVANYRRALEQGDWSNALGRELSSGQTDRTVRRLARDGGSMTEQQIDQAVERYRQNYVTYRAETIARTEGSRNVHAGLREGMQQAIDRGDVKADQVLREWIHGPSRLHSRADHVAMDGVQVRWDEPFVFSDGTRKMHPCDGNGGAKHDAGCTCTEATVLVAV